MLHVLHYNQGLLFFLIFQPRHKLAKMHRKVFVWFPSMAEFIDIIPVILMMTRKLASYSCYTADTTVGLFTCII